MAKADLLLASPPRQALINTPRCFANSNSSRQVKRLVALGNNTSNFTSSINKRNNSSLNNSSLNSSSKGKPRLRPKLSNNNNNNNNNNKGRQAAALHRQQANRTKRAK